MNEFLDPDGDIVELRAKMVALATTLAERLGLPEDALDNLIILLMHDDEFLREKARWIVGAATRH